MKTKTNDLMKDYRKEYYSRKSIYNKQVKLGYDASKLSDTRFELDIMKLSIKKYRKERRSYEK